MDFFDENMFNDEFDYDSFFNPFAELEQPVPRPLSPPKPVPPSIPTPKPLPPPTPQKFISPLSPAIMPPVSYNFKVNRYSIDQIKEFIIKNPNSYIILSCRSKSLLRLGRNSKKLYEVELIQSLRDQLK